MNPFQRYLKKKQHKERKLITVSCPLEGPLQVIPIQNTGQYLIARYRVS